MPRGRPRTIKKPHHVHLIVDRETYDALTGPMLENYRRRRPAAKANDILRQVLDDAAATWLKLEPKRAAAIAQRRSRLRVLARYAAEASDEQIERAVGRLMKFTGAI